MIICKSKAEIALMRKAGAVVAEVLTILRQAVRPGITTFELDLIADKELRARGALPSFKGYNGFPASICTSINEVVVHGIPSKDVVLKEGDIISIDCGSILNGWQGDSAITVPVGDISPQAQALIDSASDCFYEGLKHAYAGNRVGDISHAIQALAESRGYGVVRALCGHGIGQQMHEDPEVPNYGVAGRGARLRPGMALAIEPMLSAGTWQVKVLDDKWAVVPVDGSLTSHYEHTIVITEGEPELLTIPEEVSV